MMAFNDWPLSSENGDADATGAEEKEGDEDSPEFRPLEEEMRELEEKRMRQALDSAGGNQTKAAKLIGMPLRTFQAKVKQYGLRKKTAGRKSKKS